MLRILFIGDIMGRTGRNAVRNNLPDLLQKHQVDFCVANGENAAGGKGITREVADDLFACGVGALTLGNHSWNNKDVFEFIETEERLLRPANFPPGCPGKGLEVFQTFSGVEIAVLQLQGRVFMTPFDCPFRTADALLANRNLPPVRIVDFHAEATSEKNALGWYLDGRVSAVLGTHTHVVTADERIFPEGTAYQSDVGMTGALDSIIGCEIQGILDRFVRGLPVRHQVAQENVRLMATLVDVDEDTGRALDIRRISVPG